MEKRNLTRSTILDERCYSFLTEYASVEQLYEFDSTFCRYEEPNQENGHYVFPGTLFYCTSLSLNDLFSLVTNQKILSLLKMVVLGDKSIQHSRLFHDPFLQEIQIQLVGNVVRILLIHISLRNMHFLVWESKTMGVDSQSVSPLLFHVSPLYSLKDL